MSLSRTNDSWNFTSFSLTFPSWNEKEEWDWLSTLEMPDRQTAAIKEQCHPDEESAAAVYSRDALPYVADCTQTGAADKVKGGMQYIA